MTEIMYWRCKCNGPWLTVVPQTEYVRLHAAVVELNTYADHTHSCRVGETGDHADCNCGYNEAQAAAGVGDSSSTSLPE